MMKASSNEYQVSDTHLEKGGESESNTLKELFTRPEDITEKKSSENRRIGGSPEINGVIIGSLVVSHDSHEAYVDYPGNPGGTPLRVLSTVALSPRDAGKRVCLAFEEGDPTKPILLGLLHSEDPNRQQDSLEQKDLLQGVDLRIDGERLTVTAMKEIVLRCGDASITLTETGKVIVRGSYLLSRSSGVNRIKGGSVQIN